MSERHPGLLSRDEIRAADRSVGQRLDIGEWLALREEAITDAAARKILDAVATEVIQDTIFDVQHGVEWKTALLENWGAFRAAVGLDKEQQ